MRLVCAMRIAPPTPPIHVTMFLTHVYETEAAHLGRDEKNELVVSWLEFTSHLVCVMWLRSFGSAQAPPSGLAPFLCRGSMRRKEWG